MSRGVDPVATAASTPDPRRMTPTAPPIVAVDTGGTFTDAVGVWAGVVREAKVPSTPSDPAQAVRDAVAALMQAFAACGCDAARPALLVHGTTVATNALLEGRGAPTWLVTNAGLEDALEIGRQARRDLFSWAPRPGPRIVPRDRIIGVRARRALDGSALAPLDPSALDEALDVADDAPRSWAIGLLHAYADDRDERALAERIRAARPSDTITLSCDVLPVFREVERLATTVATAFVRPVMARYLARLAPLADVVHVMASSGGRLDLGRAAREAAVTALSGPAGGVVAATGLVERTGIDGVVSLDMGGTSTDVALCAGPLPLRHAAEVGDHAIHLPALDIHTIGAGGGSLVFVDDGGALRVGPQSAGADPGPACYGRGKRPTLTDANAVLGRLPDGTPLGATIRVDAARAREAFLPVAQQLGVTVEEAARGAIAIANAAMAQAVRRVSVERGVDPRGFALCAFGGAGALHAAALAEELGMRSVVVPARAGIFSAVGLLMGAEVAERSRTVLGSDDDAMDRHARALADQTRALLRDTEQQTSLTLDLRYRGQSFELGVPFTPGDAAAARQAFALAHERRFGFALDAPVEPVTLHARAEGPLPTDRIEALAAADGEALAERSGPFTITEPHTTVHVPAGWRARKDAAGHWWLEMAEDR